MRASGALRSKLADMLKAAYADGLLSDGTFTGRLEAVLSSRLIEPSHVVGDLTGRTRLAGRATAVRAVLDQLYGVVTGTRSAPPLLFGLDWSGTEERIVIGRHPECDVVLEDPTVSRHHAVLNFRGGQWVLKDLDSTNGTAVNRRVVRRCRLQPGDRLSIGGYELLVD